MKNLIITVALMFSFVAQASRPDWQLLWKNNGNMEVWSANVTAINHHDYTADIAYVRTSNLELEPETDVVTVYCKSWTWRSNALPEFERRVAAPNSWQDALLEKVCPK